MILAAFFLQHSFGDCLVADVESVPATEIKLRLMQRCLLKETDALMVVLSLMTSAVYFGCMCPVRSFRFQTGAGPLDAGRVQTKSCKSRASETSGTSDESWKTIACVARRS
jgi:hypothetical protein